MTATGMPNPNEVQRLKLADVEKASFPIDLISLNPMLAHDYPVKDLVANSNGELWIENKDGENYLVCTENKLISAAKRIERAKVRP